MNREEKSSQILSWNGGKSPQIPLSLPIICCVIKLGHSWLFLAFPFPILLIWVVELFLFLLHPLLSHASNTSLVLAICFPVQQFLHFWLDKPDFLGFCRKPEAILVFIIGVVPLGASLDWCWESCSCFGLHFRSTLPLILIFFGIVVALMGF